MWSAPAASPEVRKSLEKFSNLDLYQKLASIDPTSAHRIGEADRYRLVRALEIFELTGKSPTDLQAETPIEPDSRYHLWILDRSNEILAERIQIRTEQMIQQGLIEEYQSIYQEYPQSRALSAVGYAQVADYLQGKTPAGRKMKPGLPGLSDEIQLATRQLVKSQRTWFRNQTQKVPSSQWFELDQDRFHLEEVFKSVYESPEKER
jgi:tRNA dimethylallyltransferase